MSPAMNRINKDFQLWCLERDISVQAQHSRCQVQDNEGQIRLDALPSDFRSIDKTFGPLEVDLFALRLSAQLPTIVSWRPDPEVLATDAFTVHWVDLKAYANPPWSLVGRVLAQVSQQKADLILVSPVWKSQPWYPKLLGMCIDYLQSYRRDTTCFCQLIRCQCHK